MVTLVLLIFFMDTVLSQWILYKETTITMPGHTYLID